MSRITLWDKVDIFEYDQKYPIPVRNSDELNAGDRVCFLKSRFLPVYPSSYIVDDLIEAEVVKLGKMAKLRLIAENGRTPDSLVEFSVRAGNLPKVWAKRTPREQEDFVPVLLQKGRLPWRIETKFPKEANEQPSLES